MKRPGYFIGVDGGGTHTRALLANAEGELLGRAEAGSTNRNHHSREVVRRNLREAILTAMGDVATGQELAGIFLGMCGVSTDDDRADTVSIVREITEIPATVPVRVENDAWIGLAGGLLGRSGMVLIVGTGSACFGLREDGKSLWCGGWGALADDVGSAPWIGTRALQAAVRCEDGRIPSTLLRDYVFNFLGICEPRKLIDRIHNQGLTREEIGQLAPKVLQAYVLGDIEAKKIITDAVSELSLLVATVAKNLFQHQPSELILVGGLALSGKPFQNLLIERIIQDSPEVSVPTPEMSPVQGAVLEALKAGGISCGPEIMARIRRFG
ncbi:MAG TPA: BadF/BadG/BcrA/BcrD ATPase family protein [Gammaproteobacteria bacterium]|nr:BadF/BadG/BcrA/BcrD ATPase family protein [Gammaproteobacteria bacterium]